MVAAIAGVVGSVAGAAITSNATGKAASGQQAATAAANAEAARQFDVTNQLAAPTINAGNSARDRLTYLLGLSPTGYSGTTAAGGTGSGAATGQSADQVRNQLLAQFTTQTQNPSGGGFTQYDENGQGYGLQLPSTTEVVDEAGLQAAVNAQLAQQQASTQATTDAAATDPAYGSLAQGFEYDTYTPETFSFDPSSLYDDPSYQFRLDQGQKALDRSGAASGRLLSGAQLQASSDYNQAAASQEYGNVYNRALGTFSVNEGNRSNAFNLNESNRANAYQNNFQNTVNPLLSLAGSSTLAAGNLGQAGAAYAGAVGNNLTNQANATGAAGIAGANSINGGISAAVGGYQQQQQATQQNKLLQMLLDNNKGTTSVNNNPIGWNGGYGSTFLQNGNSSDQSYG